MQSDLRRKTTATIECPKSMVGRVIGKNGETIKALQTYTGSLIQVNQVDNPCQITISGNPQSLSLAVSMVADIVKGTFKGFALLRQVASPGMSRSAGLPTSSYPFPQPTLPPQPPQLPLPQPVYAPGYGLIPPSQLYGAEERISPSGVAGQGAHLNGFSWTTTGASPHLLGLQPAMGQQPYAHSMLNASHNPALSIQPVFNGTPFGGLSYYQNQDLGDALLYQDSGSTYPATMPDGNGAASSGAKLIQAAGRNGASYHHLNSQASGWLARPSQQVGAPFVTGAGKMVGDLLDGAGASAGGAGGNLVMDADGKVYYVNAL